MGYALHTAQIGDRHRRAKVLAGFGDAGIVEIVDDDMGDTYRAVYTVRFASIIYVLHAFQKKSRRGIQTDSADIELVRRRLIVAASDYQTRRQEGRP